MLFILIFLSFAVSLGAKLLADFYLSERIAIIGNFVGLQLTHNRGIAFSITFPPLIQTALIFVAIVCVAFVALRSSKTRCSQIGFGLILGGALGNIVDRIPDSLVTDFIQIGTFPVFNVADSCITIGVGVLLLEMLYKQKSPKNK